MAEVVNVNPFNGGGGGGGTTDYTDLTNKPKINNVILQGNKTAQDLSLEPASQACFGRYWNESLSQSKAAGFIGSLDFGKNLVANLGLGRYLVTDDRRFKKLDPEDSNKDAAGNAVLLDGSQGQFASLAVLRTLARLRVLVARMRTIRRRLRLRISPRHSAFSATTRKSIKTKCSLCSLKYLK